MFVYSLQTVSKLFANPFETTKVCRWVGSNSPHRPSSDYQDVEWTSHFAFAIVI